jgi:hypothetical protein
VLSVTGKALLNRTKQVSTEELKTSETLVEAFGIRTQNHQLHGRWEELLPMHGEEVRCIHSSDEVAER